MCNDAWLTGFSAKHHMCMVSASGRRVYRLVSCAAVGSCTHTYLHVQTMLKVPACMLTLLLLATFCIEIDVAFVIFVL